MPFDKSTLHALQFQGKRMNDVLHGVVPPDRKEALEIQKRVDDILDRRPRPYGVAPDGEIIWDGDSPWVKEQLLPAGQPNIPERPLTAHEERQVAMFGHVLSSLPEVEGPR